MTKEKLSDQKKKAKRLPVVEVLVDARMRDEWYAYLFDNLIILIDEDMRCFVGTPREIAERVTDLSKHDVVIAGGGDVIRFRTQEEEAEYYMARYE